MNSLGSDYSLQMLSIFFFLLFCSFALLVRANNTSPDIFLNICSKKLPKNAQEMDVNFVSAMELIFQNITKTGFGTAVFGTSNTVYGLGQCFNYLSPVNCQLCYSECRLKLPFCTPNTTGRIYVDGCFLRFADYNISMEATDASDTSICGNSQAVLPSISDGRVVAVKRLFFNTRQWIDKFFNEVNLVNQVQHKNLVKLFGCSVDGPESLLVYEYLLRFVLLRADPFKRKELDWKMRFNIILGTAEGLTYLHSASEVRIIHRDVKVSNILLDESFRPKIADFGLARYFEEGQSHLSTGLAGTFGYMAPEYIVHGQLTEKADIYSYGIAVLEIVTGQKNQNPVFASSDGGSLVFNVWQRFNSGTLKELLDPYLQGQCTEDEAVTVLRVGLLCIQASPNLRPPMWKVVEMLNSKSEELPTPTRPPFLNRMNSKIRSEISEASSLLSSTSRSPFSINELSAGSIRDGR